MRKIIFSIVLTIFSFESFSQTLIWEKLINYLPNQEVINSVDQDSDTTFVFCGTGAGKTFFARAELSGDTLWEKNKNVNTCYNAEFIKYLGNGKMIHIGNKNISSCSEINFLFQGLNSNGDVLNTWNYGVPGVQNILQGFVLLPDRGFLASGMKDNGSSYQLSLMKLDSSGNELWYKSFREITTGGSVIVNQKGNYVLHTNAADQPFFSVYHPYFIELTPDGDSIHSKYVIVKADTVNEIMGYDAMIQVSDGNYLFSARIDSVQQKAGTVLARYAGVVLMDSLFNIKWRTYLKPTGTQRYYTSKVIELKDSTYIVLINNDFPENQNFYLYKISKTGQVLSQKTFTSSVCNAVKLNEMKLLSDSSLIVSGGCPGNGDGYLARIGSIGLPQVVDTCKSFTASFRAEQEGDSVTFINISNGGYAYTDQSIWKFSDSTESFSFNHKLKIPSNTDSIWVRLIARNPYGCEGTVEKKVKIDWIAATNNSLKNEWKVIVYPNPSSDVFNFKNIGNNSKKYNLSLINSIGQQIKNLTFSSAEFSINANLSSGMYFYLISDEKGNSCTGKIIAE